jgi:hypothetical protein
MFKKFNWGWGIAIVYVAFAIGMLSLVYMATRNKVELVREDYYAEELKHQDHIEKVQRARALPTPLSWNVGDAQIELQFPTTDKTIAKVLFYKASDSSKDVTVSCEADSLGRCLLPTDKLVSGVYKMQVDWEANGATYYQEGTININ